MNRYEFETAMAGLLKFIPKAQDKDRVDVLTSIDALYDEFSTWKAHEFSSVVDLIIKTQKAPRIPMPAVFYDTRNKLRAASKLPQHQTYQTCSSCLGTNFVHITLTRIEDGRVDVFAKPCPECCPNHSHGKLPIRPGWREATPSEADYFKDHRHTPGWVHSTHGEMSVIKR